MPSVRKRTDALRSQEIGCPSGVWRRFSFRGGAAQVPPPEVIQKGTRHFPPPLPYCCPYPCPYCTLTPSLPPRHFLDYLRRVIDMQRNAVRPRAPPPAPHWERAGTAVVCGGGRCCVGQRRAALPAACCGGLGARLSSAGRAARGAGGQVCDMSSLNINDPELPDTVLRQVRVRTLLLANNQLADIHGSITVLTDLRAIDLDHNRLQHIPECLFRITTLESIRACENQLAVVGGGISSLERLQALHLSHNPTLEFLPPALGTLPLLTTLQARPPPPPPPHFVLIGHTASFTPY